MLTALMWILTWISVSRIRMFHSRSDLVETEKLGLYRLVDKAEGRIAQLVEQLTLNQRVVGSNPTAPTI
jgi:hypothetical protein